MKPIVLLTASLLALLHISGATAQRKPLPTMVELKQSAERGDPEAALSLGMRYRDGRNIPARLLGRRSAVPRATVVPGPLARLGNAPHRLASPGRGARLGTYPTPRTETLPSPGTGAMMAVK